MDFRSPAKAGPFRFAEKTLRALMVEHGHLPPLRLQWTGHRFRPDPVKTPGYPTLADYESACQQEQNALAALRTMAVELTQKQFPRRRMALVTAYLDFKGRLTYKRRLSMALVAHSLVFKQVLRLLVRGDQSPNLLARATRFRKVLPALSVAQKEGKLLMALVLRAVEASPAVFAEAKAEPRNVLRSVKRYYLGLGWSEHAWRAVSNACAGTDRTAAALPPVLVNALCHAGVVSKLPQLGTGGIGLLVRHSDHCEQVPAPLYQAFATALVGVHPRAYYQAQVARLRDCLDMYDWNLTPRVLPPPTEVDVPKGARLNWWVRKHDAWAKSPRGDMPKLYWEAGVHNVPAHPKFTVVELISSDALTKEGTVMHHCVAGYDRLCKYAQHRIVSIRATATGKRVATAELRQTEMGTLHVLQVRGPCNAPVPPEVARYVNQLARDNAGPRAAAAQIVN